MFQTVFVSKSFFFGGNFVLQACRPNTNNSEKCLRKLSFIGAGVAIHVQ